MEAFNEMDAIDRIKRLHPIITKLTPVKEEGGLLNMEIGGNKLNNKAFIVMCSQFAIILNAGIPIARTVHLIAEKTTDKPLKKMLLKVAEDVEGGRSIAASFAERGEKLLPATFVETIAAGEQSGNLDKAFQTVHEHFDKQAKMAAKVRGALAYPVFVMFIAVAVVVVLMVKVVPTFLAIFDSYDAQLPLPTRMLIAISNFFTKYWMVMLAIISIVGIVYKVYGNTEEGRMNLAKWSLKVPVLGNIQILNAASEFANTLTTMLSSGLPLTRAINITAKTMSNYFMSTEVGKLAVKLEEGRGLGASMREANFMPDILVDMVSVGEETGEMEKTLHTIAGYYDAELDMAIASALAKLEPALLVGLAGIAGFIVVAIYMAMFGMYAAM
jgi:type IV pilus assembly protein PilC